MNEELKQVRDQLLFNRSHWRTLARRAIEEYGPDDGCSAFYQLKVRECDRALSALLQ